MRYLFTLLLLISIASYGQQLPRQIVRCYTHESIQDYRRTHPNAQTDEQFEAWMTQKTNERLATGRVSVAYTIPVIFHVIHNGEPVGTGSNLSAAQIQQQLNQLNADFSNASGSTYPVAANTELTFCLAVVSPEGLPLAEPGIHRVNRNTAGFIAPPYNGFASNSYVDVTIMPSTIWNPHSYYNVWTMELSGGLLGKATFPAGSTLADLAGVGESDTKAGVFVDWRSVGSVGTPGPFGASAGLGRTLSHESGHFFALRHIWGDGDCTASDFCADTPPQDGETAGCPPAGTLNGCTPSVAKMFENYMDYTFDNCVNTLTNDQKTRIQTVMANSPRRTTLATSGVCTPPPGNSIRFSAPTFTVAETGTILTCPRYREFTVNVNVYTAATGNATVTFNKAGTATDNVDYIVTPSSVSYTNGDGAQKTVTIRIWDDAVVETPETIVLTYTITGTGVIAAPVQQSVTVTINDDDITPAVTSAGGTVARLNENFGVAGGTFPAGWANGPIGAPGVNVWTVSTNGGAGITGQAAHITNNTTTDPLTYTKSGVNSTSQSLLITPLINAAGYTNTTLSFTYKCEGEEDVDGIYDYGVLLYSFNGSSFNYLVDGAGIPFVLIGSTAATQVLNLPLPSFLANTNFYLGFLWVNDNSFGSDPPLLIDDVVVNGTARGVESQVTHSGVENIFSGQDVYISSANDQQVIARIQSPSANIGCLTATVSQAGNGQVAITTGAGSYQRTQKVFQITPTTPTTTTTYTGTLFFTSAELAVWGGNRLNLKILKVRDGVNLEGVISSADAELITPTSATEDVAAGVIRYTGNFTGFSQFMLVSQNLVLPVRLLTFDAKPSGKVINLTWSTSEEINNRGFNIERSTDGINFTSIGWENGKGNTTSVTKYSFNDNYVHPNTVYYYRLRQQDYSGREELSAIRQAKIDGVSMVVTVSPNPAKDRINVFVAGTNKRAYIELINAKGQVVKQWKDVDAFSSSTWLDVAGLPAGVYGLSIHVNEEKVVKKIMIQ